MRSEKIAQSLNRSKTVNDFRAIQALVLPKCQEFKEYQEY
jgi:hypothetical protein